MSDQQPFVSIVTPMYNGEPFLRECIESVLSQTYRNWEYVIVNNCSKDNSLAIIADYAKREPRIRIINNEDFLSSIDNQNNALRQMSPASKYCKIVHTDDWIYPECIEKMVELAERDPDVGIVTSYVLSNTGVFGFGISYQEEIVDGRIPCRLLLLENKYLLGNCTSQLIRSDLIRSRDEFYESPYWNFDQIILFDLLRDCKFGFLHQFLTFMRHHGDQGSAITTRCVANALDRLILLKRFGGDYLSPEEFKNCWNEAEKNYYLQCGQGIFQLMKPECRKYHKDCLEKANLKFNKLKLTNGIIKAAFQLLLKPRKLVRIIKNKLK